MKIFISLFAALLSLSQVSALVPQLRLDWDVEVQNCDYPSRAIPLRRGYTPSGKDHFYTTNTEEMRHAVEKLGFNFEGNAAYVFPSSSSYTVPLYRMYSQGAVDHFYTTSASEGENAIKHLGYTDEGTAAWVYPKYICGSIPLYRAYSPSAKDHFYTTSASEHKKAVAELGYSNEGVAASHVTFTTQGNPSSRAVRTYKRWDCGAIYASNLLPCRVSHPSLPSPSVLLVTMVDRMQVWEEELNELSKRGPDTIINVKPPAKNAIRLSPEIRSFLREEGEVRIFSIYSFVHNAYSFHVWRQIRQFPDSLLQLPIVIPPPPDDTRPLTEYFISSSHNTYLLSGQLLGHSSALSYVHVLWQHARCVEMDVWSSAEGPIVTHGYTFSSSVPFREVCEAIGQAVRPSDWPVLVSLECHVEVDKQETLVQIMEECWGEKLLRSPIVGPSTEVTPGDLKGRIVVMVEYYPPNITDSSATEPPGSSSPSLDSSSIEQKEISENKGSSKSAHVSDALAALGVYARKIQYPVHILINISESALSALLPHALEELIANAQLHLRRVYPRGTRVESSNPDPLASWSAGSHIAALNWQSYDLGVQINEAMFVGTPGWVVKPPKLLASKRPTDKRLVKLKCHVVGLSSLPTHKDTKRISTYLCADLFSFSTKETDTKWRSETVQCEDPIEGLADFLWDTDFEFQYETNGLTFLRIRVKENVEYGRDPEMAVFVARVEHIQTGWRFVRMLDRKGKDTGSTLLLRFDFEDVV
ncbi:hypothetical protein EW146_g7218 [Bondarzewia mesenterica]|uniref:Phosphoinositide phospholipase C n=1 Tax=Bondarzewia mesenterica TaxID=1095465 RepID=A0A4S4LNB6_9AGAM|nr:hypothetical protein EW146_g7218 [Bondarzewia mesenterica]